MGEPHPGERPSAPSPQVRTPVCKALLAGAITLETYGWAFGFERMMDTLGAIVGPATALLLLPL